MVVAIAAGALLLTATVVAMAPRVWGIANAHVQVPVELPDFATLSQRSVLLNTNGEQMASYEIENSEPVTIDELPEPVITAFLAVEDDQFFSHHGVNVRSLFRANLSNFAADGPTQGASTITMQVVKNDYLAGLERDGRYKLLQIAYAVRLEKQKTKDQILERYLNTVFFGENSYGIGAAAETYFGKPASELTFVEAAFLAGLVQAPSSYDPITRPERSRARFEQVLNRLVLFELMTPEERAQVSDTFVIPLRVRRRDDRTSVRTHYTEAIKDYLLNKTSILGDTYEERYAKLYRGGLTIYSTIDPAIQASAEAAQVELPQNAAGIDSALTTIDNKTGAIRAMVGGRPFEAGKNEFNLALAPSQTGSSIKIFILAAAVQAGAIPDDIIDGVRGCEFPTDNPAEPVFKITGGVAGAVDDLRWQTQHSVNCAFARLSMIVGLNRVVDTVYRMSRSPYLYRDQPDRAPIQPFQAFATGANEMSTLDMASGMQTIANVGIHQEPFFVERIVGPDGTDVYTHESEGVRVLDRQAALTTIDLLHSPLQSGGTASRELGEFARQRPAIGKTGTQDKNTTAWFVGATPQLSTAVLVRDPDRYTSMTGIPEFSALRRNVQGGTYPARIWGALMQTTGLDRLTEDWEAEDSPSRKAARLYLPGVECVYKVTGYTRGFAGRDPWSMSPALTPEQSPDPVATVPPAPAPDTNPPSTNAPRKRSRRPVYQKVPGGTTVPPDLIDPNAPLPSIAANTSVRKC